MDDFFDSNGHLTDYAFRELIRGQPEELRRLEAAEHLAFCDECVDRYSAMMEDTMLVAPIESVSKGVMAKIRARARRVFMNKYATAAIAACFALVLWTTGAFHLEYNNMDNRFENAIKRSGRFSYIARDFSREISEGLNEFFNGIINTKGDI